MKRDKSKIIKLVLIILSCVLLIVLSLLAIVSYALVISFSAVAGATVSSLPGDCLIFNALALICTIVGAGLMAKYRLASGILLCVAGALSVVMPIAFAVVGVYGFCAMLLIPTVLLLVSAGLSFRRDKIVDNSEVKYE